MKRRPHGSDGARPIGEICGVCDMLTEIRRPMPASGSPDAVSADDSERLILRLYVAGDAPNSTAARANLKRLLESRQPDSYSVEIVDCLAEPLRAIEEGVFVTPTLLRIS